jgi:hypothetical protein
MEFRNYIHFLQKIIYLRVNRSEKGGEKSGSGINDYVTSLFDQGGFLLLDLIIKELKNHMTC